MFSLSICHPSKCTCRTKMSMLKINWYFIFIIRWSAIHTLAIMSVTHTLQYLPVRQFLKHIVHKQYSLVEKTPKNQPYKWISTVCVCWAIGKTSIVGNRSQTNKQTKKKPAILIKLNRTSGDRLSGDIWQILCKLFDVFVCYMVKGIIVSDIFSLYTAAPHQCHRNSMVASCRNRQKNNVQFWPILRCLLSIQWIFVWCVFVVVVGNWNAYQNDMVFNGHSSWTPINMA